MVAQRGGVILMMTTRTPAALRVSSSGKGRSSHLVDPQAGRRLTAQCSTRTSGVLQNGDL
jgi:hypothetical protein